MITARQIDRYLKKQGSPLAGYGSVFVREARRNGLPAGLLVAIAGAESSFGKITSGSHNPFGWGPGIAFPSWQSAITSVAKGLRTGYFDQGRTSVSAIGSKWAPSGAANDPTNLNSNWTKNVNKFMSELGGGMSTGGSVSPPNATGAIPAPSGLPGAASSLGILSDIASGTYDPLKSLSDLTASIGASPTGPAPVSPTGDPVSSGSTTYNGQPTTHQTDGLPGYPAIDIFGKAGTAFAAPENGKVVRWSGSGGTSGNVFGYSVYFQGDSGKKYFVTHLQAQRAPVGRRLRKGQRIGRISPWSGGSSHAHVGIHG